MSNAINHQVNRLRLSLWDVFSFFLTGIVFGIIVLIGFVLFVEMAIVDIAKHWFLCQPRLLFLLFLSSPPWLVCWLSQSQIILIGIF